MWDKIKNILTFIGGAFVAAMLFCLGRRSIYGSAGDSSESALGQLGEGIDKCKGEVKHAEERIEAGIVVGAAGGLAGGYYLMK